MNGLTQKHLEGYIQSQAPWRPMWANFARLTAGRRAVPSRVSVPVSGADKLNLYYVLMDPPGRKDV